MVAGKKKKNYKYLSRRDEKIVIEILSRRWRVYDSLSTENFLVSV